MSDQQTTSLPARSISGRWMVIAMFTLGFTATGLLYAYSTLHLGPFKPLQEAIVREFPGSSPRVDGGKKRMHQNTPTVLRILMKSGIDPLSKREESIRELNSLRKRVAELTLEKVPLPDLSILELHVFKPLPEGQIHQSSYRLNIRSGEDWIEIDQRGEPVQEAAAAF